MRSLFTAIVLVLGVLLASPSASADVKEGDRAPELDKAKLSSGKAFQLRAQRGKWVALTFGASWCKPCKKELPVWDKLAPRYQGKLVFLAVNIDGDPRKGEQFLDKLKIKNLTRVFMPASSVDPYDAGTFPSTFVIDPNGVVRVVHKGFESGDDKKLAQRLDALVK